MTDKAFIDRVWSIIQRIGSQKKLGDTLGINPTVINSWVNRGSKPSVEQLVNIKEKLGVSIDWLLTGQESRVGYAHHVAEEMAEYGHRRYPEDIKFIADVLKDLKDKDKQRFESAKKAIEGLLEACASESIEAVELKKRPYKKQIA